MFNLFHKMFAGLMLTKPSVHHLQPKSVNIYFKNAIEPKYTLLNLKNYDHIDISVVKISENNDNKFNLQLDLTHNNITENLIVAAFETAKEAKMASTILRNKLFSVEKTLLRFVITVAVVFLVIMYILSLFLRPPLRQVASLPPYAATAPAANYGGLGIPTGMSNSQYMQMQQQAIEDAKSKARLDLSQYNPSQNSPVVQNQNQTPATPTVDVPQNSEVNSFINKLNK